jgi:hypothetical protein
MKPTIKIILLGLLFQLFIAFVLNTIFNKIAGNIVYRNVGKYIEIMQTKYFTAFGISILLCVFTISYLRKKASVLCVVLAVVCEIIGYFVFARLIL